VTTPRILDDLTQTPPTIFPVTYGRHSVRLVVRGDFEAYRCLSPADQNVQRSKWETDLRTQFNDQDLRLTRVLDGPLKFHVENLSDRVSLQLRRQAILECAGMKLLYTIMPPELPHILEQYERGLTSPPPPPSYHSGNSVNLHDMFSGKLDHLFTIDAPDGGI